ncbi:MAG: glutathione S-transferase family protein [Alphaproteobacteria bacterium]|jgi:glutathione S-transferase|nr:glutathione S-transferase family protein [Alphaproteobacteria bacterium]
MTVRLYDYLPSGNGYKVRLALTRLGVPFTLIERDITQGETRTPEFLALNPNGRIPLVVLEDGRRLAESNAILCYFAEGTDLLPADPYDKALVLQWLFFEQYSHEPYIATLRFWLQHLGLDETRAAQLPWRRRQGYAALGVMEGHLAGNAFFVGGRFTIADIALYAYTHVAHEAEYDLSGYPAVRAWLDRVAAEPGHVPIDARPGA